MIVYGILELSTGYQQVINRLLTGYQQVININVNNFLGGGWLVGVCLSRRIGPRMGLMGAVAACAAPEGLAVG